MASSPKNLLRILILDIETAPILANVWRTWKENVSPDQIEKDWYILSFAAKWFGTKRVIYKSQQGAKDIEDDKKMLVGLWHLLNEADIVVAHNGKKFDMRKINARFILNGLPPPSPYRVVDTLEVARRHFAFSSNRLAYLTDKLCAEKKLAHAKFPGFMLWKECLRGNPEAWEEMRIYNQQDVVSLEELYVILRPWVEGHPNVAVQAENEDVVRCPKCGSANVIFKGDAVTNTGLYRRVRCKDCGGWSRTRYTQNSKVRRANLLSN